MVRGKKLNTIRPYRIGTTSYIIPNDILPNVKVLAGMVDDIELVLFESDFSNIPDRSTIEELIELAEENDITYTVHFPLDIALGDTVESTREKSLETCFHIIDLLEPVHPFAYLVHCNGGDFPPGKFTKKNIEGWEYAVRRSLDELCKTSVEPSRFCVETLSYPFELIEKTVSDLDMSVCLDIGHILLNGYSLEEYLSRYLDRTRVIHLHGIRNGKDHQSISHMSDTYLKLLFEHVSNCGNCDRVVTLEVFNEMDLTSSLEILEAYIP